MSQALMMNNAIDFPSPLSVVCDCALFVVISLMQCKWPVSILWETMPGHLHI
jgi:hypothetical protein